MRLEFRVPDLVAPARWDERGARVMNRDVTGFFCPQLHAGDVLHGYISLLHALAPCVLVCVPVGTLGADRALKKAR